MHRWVHQVWPGLEALDVLSTLLWPGAACLAPCLASLGSGLGMDSPVVCVVDEDYPRALAPCLEFPGWHHLCSHPQQFTFLTSG